MPWARIGEFVGQRNLAVTANTYTHVLFDEAEVDYGALLALCGTRGVEAMHRPPQGVTVNDPFIPSGNTSQWTW